MKNYQQEKLSIYFTTVFFVFLFSSCQRDNSSAPPVNIDSLASMLPKQFSREVGGDPAVTFSIKYDTTNFRIEVYYDDTTNSNPYDMLYMIYIYNSQGYFQSRKKFDQLQDLVEFDSVNRAADNKIIWIAKEDNMSGGRDTSFFTYQTRADTTEVENIVKYVGLGFYDTIVYTYGPDFKLASVTSTNAGGLMNLEYNANNSIKKNTAAYNSGNWVKDYYYASGLPDGKEDLVYKVFMGQDHYMENFRSLYEFSLYRYRGIYEFDIFHFSFTDPFHPTRLLATYNPNYGIIEIDDFRFSYELNSNSMPSKVTGSTVGYPSQVIIRFKY